MMKRPEVARDFFTHHLPRTLLNHMELSTLKLEDCSFIDEKLKQHESDVLFSVRKKDSEKEVFLYTLVEHQSKSDELMPFRLLYYMMQIIKRHVIAHRKNPLPLPFIYPLVVYNGNSPWNHRRDFLSLFGSSEDKMRNLLLDEFPLLDVSDLAESDLKKAYVSNLMLASLRRAESQKALENKVKLLSELFLGCYVEASDDVAKAVLSYLTSTGVQLEDDSATVYWDILEEGFPPKYEEVIMNLREATINMGIKQGIQQGIEQGIEQERKRNEEAMISLKQATINMGIKQGIQQGIEQGIEQASKVAAIRMIKKGMSFEDISEITELSVESLKKIEEELKQE